MARLPSDGNAPERWDAMWVRITSAIATKRSPSISGIRRPDVVTRPSVAAIRSGHEIVDSGRNATACAASVDIRSQTSRILDPARRRGCQSLCPAAPHLSRRCLRNPSVSPKFVEGRGLRRTDSARRRQREVLAGGRGLLDRPSGEEIDIGAVGSAACRVHLERGSVERTIRPIGSLNLFDGLDPDLRRNSEGRQAPPHDAVMRPERRESPCERNSRSLHGTAFRNEGGRRVRREMGPTGGQLNGGGP